MFSQYFGFSCLLQPEFLLSFCEVLASLKPPKREMWPAAHLFTSSHLVPARPGTRINTHRLLKGHWGDAHFGLLKRMKALNAVMAAVWIVWESQGIGILICAGVSGICLLWDRAGFESMTLCCVHKSKLSSGFGATGLATDCMGVGTGCFPYIHLNI